MIQRRPTFFTVTSDPTPEATIPILRRRPISIEKKPAAATDAAADRRNADRPAPKE